ncbi:hypothetical protein JOC78_002259 [Bacillus ectoiniformans]|uniref:S-layer homology domain-containing protein n=1 Tax=Bacillus ectoiniformans TaxID=1494429 RepID=UPI001956FCD9|nr:S-layer homology domain-containing protein [Bacillus ectoiniformans]MBM7649306.1 hypothetical protein [Bacillus ectoiniformans]
MKKLQIFLSFLLLLSVVFSSQQQAEAATFKDVNSSFWGQKEINYLVSKQIIKGYQDGTFRPNNQVTNSQVAIMLVRALKLNTNNRPDPGMKDVPRTHPSYKEIATAVDEGFFPKAAVFYPNASITREAMARAVVNAFDFTGTSKVGFKDVPASYWAHSYITKLAANRIVIGYSDHTFRPKNKVTRAQFSAFVARSLSDTYKTQDIETFRLQNRQVSGGLKLNPSKTYVYQMNTDYYTGKETWYYTGSYYGWDDWTAARDRGDDGFYSYLEDRTRMAVGWQESEIAFEIPYPITLNSKWTFGSIEWNGYVDYYVVTNMAKTITTPAGTFRNVIEIKNYDGFYSYYAEGVGHILTIDATVTPAKKIIELIKVY